MSLDRWGKGSLGVVQALSQSHRTQNLSKMAVLFEMVGNNHSRLFSSTPCGKNATTPRSARASGPSYWNRGEASDSLIVAARLSFCWVCSTLVRRFSHSRVNRLMSHLFWCATVTKRAIESGWKSSCSRMGLTVFDQSASLS